LGCKGKEKVSHGEMGGDDKTKRVWGPGFYRYQINKSMFSFKMDCQVGERRCRHVYFIPEEEVSEREGVLVLILVGRFSILEGASWHKIYLPARFEI
jgi:hypothetical protein